MERKKEKKKEKNIEIGLKQVKNGVIDKDGYFFSHDDAPEELGDDYFELMKSIKEDEE